MTAKKKKQAPVKIEEKKLKVTGSSKDKKCEVEAAPEENLSEEEKQDSESPCEGCNDCEQAECEQPESEMDKIIRRVNELKEISFYEGEPEDYKMFVFNIRRREISERVQDLEIELKKMYKEIKLIEILTSK